MRKIVRIFSILLDRFQNDEVFHASQLQQIMDERMVRMFGLHQNNRYFAQSLSRTNGTTRYVASFSLRPKMNGKKTRGIVSKNKEAGQIQESKRRHNYREDLDPEKLDWLFWLSHNWKWYGTSAKISGSACLGKPRSLHQ